MSVNEKLRKKYHERERLEVQKIYQRYLALNDEKLEYGGNEASSSAICVMFEIIGSFADGEAEQKKLGRLLNDLVVCAKQINEPGDSVFNFEEAIKAARSSLARAGSEGRHTENRAMKADVFKWLNDNFASCKSMDAAAEAMSGKLVPATFRTVRDWVTEWKKLRSASTP
ncbi:MAG: hypothetical protein Q8S32_14600 [Burkholderiaceae bacterium]|nr:hypothetical protein [Burkholderiaceae bacterium]